MIEEDAGNALLYNRLLILTLEFGPEVTPEARLTRVVSLCVDATPYQWPEISSDTGRMNSNCMNDCQSRFCNFIVFVLPMRYPVLNLAHAKSASMDGHFPIGLPQGTMKLEICCMQRQESVGSQCAKEGSMDAIRIMSNATVVNVVLQMLLMEIKKDKYIGDILKKFRFSDVRSSNTPMDKENPWGKDGTGKDVELHLYRSMIGSLMYLTTSRPDIMFSICACARHQVTPKECHFSKYIPNSINFRPAVLTPIPFQKS
nr:putative polyprotein [Tanacetum cinerariifolium]